MTIDNPLWSLIDGAARQGPTKIDGYEIRVAKKILAALQIESYGKVVGVEDFDFGKCQHDYFPTIFGIEVIKLSSPVTLAQLTSKLKKTDLIVKKLVEATDNWPHAEAHAVVFDYHGDKIGDLVLHTATYLFDVTVDSNDWFLFVRSPFGGTFWCIEPLGAFIEKAYMRK